MLIPIGLSAEHLGFAAESIFHVMVLPSRTSDIILGCKLVQGRGELYTTVRAVVLGRFDQKNWKKTI